MLHTALFFIILFGLFVLLMIEPFEIADRLETIREKKMMRHGK